MTRLAEQEPDRVVKLLVAQVRVDRRRERARQSFRRGRPHHHLVTSVAVGGPSTQLTSHAPSTVMNVNEASGSHAS